MNSFHTDCVMVYPNHMSQTFGAGEVLASTSIFGQCDVKVVGEGRSAAEFGTSLPLILQLLNWEFGIMFTVMIS